jgi:hypothetical protein
MNRKQTRNQHQHQNDEDEMEFLMKAAAANQAKKVQLEAHWKIPDSFFFFQLVRQFHQSFRPQQF